MTYDVNYVTCPKCGHDRNPSTAANCEICGMKLKDKGIPPAAWIGLGALVLLLGGGYYFLNNKPQIPTLGGINTPTPTPTPAPTPTPTPGDPVASPDVKVYRSMSQVEKVPSGLFNYGGSTTFAPLRSQTVNDAITTAHPDFKLRYTEPLTGKPGSGAGIQMLMDGQLDIAQSSRPLKDTEFSQAQSRGFKLEQVPIAIDGIAFYTNPDIKVPGLTIDQLKGMLTGKITNWKQVGGPNLPVIAFSRDIKAGGTVDFVNENILDKQGLGSTVKTVRDTTDALRKVATTPGGIGYATASEVIGQRTVRPMPLGKSGSQFVAPFTSSGEINASTFQDGSYPLTRRLFVIIRRDGKADEQAGAAYANLLLSDEGQKFIAKEGFVPIR
jgi:phosphate transport system substrate-binding protein